jgi:formate dehydrogenase maturation protein FdhE
MGQGMSGTKIPQGDNETRKPKRNAQGQLLPGERLNASGVDRYKARMLNQLNQLTPRAIARLGQLIESDSEQVALGAVKEVLDRNLGKPKASLDVKVEASLSALHLQALEELAARQVIARDARMIDVTPAATASPTPSMIDAMDYSDGKG